MNDYEKDALNLFEGLGTESSGIEDTPGNDLLETGHKEWEFEPIDLEGMDSFDPADDSINKGTYIHRKKEKFLGVITIQAILCVAVLIAVFAVKTVSQDAGSAIKEEYILLYTQDVNWKHMYTQFSEGFQNFINKFTPIQDERDTGSQDSSPSGQTSSDSQENSSTPDAGSQSSAGAVKEDTGNSQIGGELQVRYPPEGASFAPVVYFGTPVLPVNGAVTSGFGYREDPLTGEVSFHKGIDIAADEGTNIAVMASGTVTIVEASDSYGKYILIDHGNNFLTLYAHCSKLLVSTGDMVKKGQVIAQVGSTGRTNGSHLHFEMIKDNLRIDPSLIFTEKGNG